LSTETGLRRDARYNLDRILASATEVFARNGLGATLADVAAQAGVGVGTVYRRFSNKNELIYEVYADRVHATEALVRDASDAADIWPAFVRFLEESTRQLAGDRGMRELTTGGYTELLGWARGSTPERLATLLEDNHKVMGVHISKLVRRAKKAGELRVDFQPTDMMMLSLAVQATIDFGGAERPELYRRALTLILDGLRPTREQTSKLPAPALSEADLLSIRRR
jgi:AcrR family transcriptional regulator